MGFIDSIVAAISPKAAYEREIYKIAADGLRSLDSYDAGSYERNNRNWNVTNESAEITDRYSRDTIRARARDLERNSDIMNSITSAWKRNIIGSGFILQAKTPDAELNKQIERAWKKWCKKQNCDVTQTQSLNQMLRMAVNRKKVDGGILFIKRMLPTQGLNGSIGRGTGADGKRMSYEGKTIAPGMMKELNAGDEIQVASPAGQSADATSYTKLEQRMISASQGLSYEATSRDMAESTYSSARQNIIEDDLTYQEDVELIKEIIDEIYETFVISLVLSGTINVSGFWENKDSYFDHEWIKEPKPWIDPAKESNANKVALMTGQKTFKQIAAENGRDWKDQIDDMAEVLNYGNEKGIDMGGVIFGIQKKE